MNVAVAVHDRGARTARALFLFLALLVGLLLAPGCGLRTGPSDRPEAGGARPPNLVLILCDDLGYGDLGSYGSPLGVTPRIDRLAAEGMRLTDYYVTGAVCTPSRASLMTGSYPRRVSLDDDEGYWVLEPGSTKGLHPDEVTLAEMLRERGYRTACVGKWHLGVQEPFLPRSQGFDEHFGVLRLAEKEAPPLVRNGTVIDRRPPPGGFTRRYTDEAQRFLRENRGRPFFLYLAHHAPHWPVVPGRAFRGRTGHGAYADVVAELDWSTGAILDELETLGLDGNTLVVFTSDNGAARRGGGSNAPFRGFKGDFYEGGMRVPFIARWPGRIPAGRVSSELVTVMDLLPTVAPLAGASLPTDRTLDGHDIWPILSGEPEARSPHESFLYYQVSRLRAVRAGRWKLHTLDRALFDLEADPGETRNEYGAHPEVLERLLAIAEAARAELGDGSREGSGQRPAGFSPPS